MYEPLIDELLANCKENPTYKHLTNIEIVYLELYKEVIALLIENCRYKNYIGKTSDSN
jgi:hypothetical protein